MNRRNFLGSLIGGVAAGAAVRTWPFRIFSFPKEIVIPSCTRRLDFLCDFANGTAVRDELVLENGVWRKQDSSTVSVGKVDWQVIRAHREDTGEAYRDW